MRRRAGREELQNQVHLRIFGVAARLQPNECFVTPHPDGRIFWSPDRVIKVLVRESIKAPWLVPGPGNTVNALQRGVGATGL